MTNGVNPSYRVYETYYLETFLSDYSPSTVAWIGSIQAFAQFSATLISGPITDRYGPMASYYLLRSYNGQPLLTGCDFLGNNLAVLTFACDRDDAYQPLYQVLPIPPLPGNPSWHLLWPHFCPGSRCRQSLLLQETSHGYVLRLDWLTNRRHHLPRSYEQSPSKLKRRFPVGSACMRFPEPLPTRASCCANSSNAYEKEGQFPSARGFSKASLFPPGCGTVHGCARNLDPIFLPRRVWSGTWNGPWPRKLLIRLDQCRIVRRAYACWLLCSISRPVQRYSLRVLWLWNFVVLLASGLHICGIDRAVYTLRSNQRHHYSANDVYRGTYCGSSK